MTESSETKLFCAELRILMVGNLAFNAFISALLVVSILRGDVVISSLTVSVLASIAMSLYAKPIARGWLWVVRARP